MSIFVGIDAGSFRSPSWFAYLEGAHFRFAHRRFKPDDLILECLADKNVLAVAVDAPQGLPKQGERSRLADRFCATRTQAMPQDASELRHALQGGRKRFVCLPLIELGSKLFWANRNHLHGLVSAKGKLIETYPLRILRHWPDAGKIPSKDKESEVFTELVARLFADKGFSWEGADKLRVDYYDAMLCAIAAKAHWEGMADELGNHPAPDDTEGVLREGLIIVPSQEWFTSCRP